MLFRSDDCWDHLTTAADQLEIPFDAVFLADNLPVYLDMKQDPLWLDYPNEPAQQCFKEAFIDRIADRLEMEREGRGTMN